tara:strand:+ start:1191 stop:2432 length:1242 start_codon:yes stop_codon:yes gene_type:complete
MLNLNASLASDIRITSVISGGHMFSHFYFMVFGPIMPLLVEELNFSYTMLAVILSAYSFSSFAVQTPIGFIVDKFGARVPLIAGLLIMSVSIMAIGYSVYFWQFVLLYAIAGMANSVFHPADYSIISGSVDEKRMGRAFGVHLFSGHFGWVICPATMIGASAVWGWRGAFIAVGLTGIAYSFFMLTQWTSLDGGNKKRVSNDGKDGSQDVLDNKSSSLASGIRLLFTFPVLMCLLFFVFLTLGFTGIRTFFVSAMEVLNGMSLENSNGVLTGFIIGSTIGISVGGILADKIGPNIWIAAISLIGAGCLIVFSGTLPMSVNMLLCIMTLAGVFLGLLLPSRDLLVRRVTPKGSMGKVVGFLSTGMMGSAAVAPLIFGFFLDDGNANLVFWISGIFVALALFTFATTPQRTPVEK